MKKVSVIMPNYNHAPFLRERMDSILSQDYSEYEVIVLDDASTDGSRAILNEYAGHPRVKLLLTSDTNSGNTFVQWQRGMAHADGDYIWIAESDDVASPHLLSRLVETIERENAVLSFCRSRWIDGQGNTLPRTQDKRWSRDFVMDGNAFAKQFLLGYSSICNASAVLFRRDAAERIDMSRVAQFTASGDRLFWIEMALQGRVVYVAEMLNGFRQHVHKVSGGAEYEGTNIVQDHAIYRLVAPNMNLTGHEKRLVCGYHWQAMHRASVSQQGCQRAMAAWQQEPEFGRTAYMIYMIHRAIEKC